MRRLVTVNGRALSVAEQKKEAERVADEIKEIEKELGECAFFRPLV